MKIRHSSFPFLNIIVVALFFLFIPRCASAESDSTSVYKQAERKKIKFNTGFITGFNKNIDISWLENADSLQPGRYLVEVFVNGKNLQTHQIDFLNAEGKVIACITETILGGINLDKKKLPEGWQEKECLNLPDTIPDASAEYDYENERLNITIPQLYLLGKAEGYIDPSRWDEGINSLSLGYSFSGTRGLLKKQQNQSTLYGNFMTTLRLGAWRLNTYDTLVGGSGQGMRLGHMQAYATRAIAPFLSEVSVGDLNTSGEFFDFTSLRGAVLRTDERMFPWTVRGFAPEIRGLANSNAVVTIRQNNNILYQQSVPPGEFNIRNLAALGYGGDLEVTVTESNGAIRTFNVPFSSIPQLLRKGFYKYSIATGQVRNSGLATSPHLQESSLQYGVSNNITLYGGVQNTFDKTYLSLISGLAVNTFMGALSADLTRSYVPEWITGVKDNSLTMNGRYKFGLSKLVNQTGTNISLANYYLTGRNFYTLNEALQLKEHRNYGDNGWQPDRFRRRLEVTLTQELPPEWGQVSLSGWWEKNKMTGSNNSRSSYLLTYRNSYNAVNYRVSLNQTFTYEGKEDTALSLNVSLPFGPIKRSMANLRATMSYSNTESSFKTSVNGTHQGENDIMSFSSYLSKPGQSRANFGMNVGHTGSALHKGISYSYSNTHSSLSGNVSGGVLVHGDGVKFSSYTGDTMALIHAPDAVGATLMGNKLSRIGSDGYGVLSYLNPYTENVLIINAKGAPIGFEPENNGIFVVPTSGAVVKVDFINTNENKRSVIARIKNKNGDTLPFGARIYDDKETALGTVGQGGIVIVSLPDDYQPLEVRWRKGDSNESCEIQPWELKDTGNEFQSSVSLFCQMK